MCGRHENKCSRQGIRSAALMGRQHEKFGDTKIYDTVVFARGEGTARDARFGPDGNVLSRPDDNDKSVSEASGQRCRGHERARCAFEPLGHITQASGRIGTGLMGT